ncbi:uncharacterized protein LOC129913506 [Episyrphus balteatus]|uniref:uncharacterized protein LOC129913506 n=1 Tax=Episyrphus balteatus TaxID=286459 RepID=UPI002485F1C1|nr:uncharacterized protein LOC129913506 [Episyrphus balteatus]
MECATSDLFRLMTLLMSLVLATTAAGGGRDPSLPHNVCSKEITIQGDQIFTWKHSKASETDFVISEPACLQKNGTIILRKCAAATGEWIPKNSPKCDHAPESFSPDHHVCPEDLIEIPTRRGSKPLCVKISDETVAWSDRLCLGSDATIFDLNDHERDAIYQYLRSHEHIKAFWIPVQRADGNRYNPLIWKLPGREWGDHFTKVEYNELSDKSCLIATVNPIPVFEMSHCRERHHSVCVFKRKNLAIKSVCPINYGALSYKPNICYGIEWDVEPHQGARQLSTGEYFGNRNAIRQIFNMIDYDEDEYFLLSPAHIDGVRYNLLMNIKEKLKIGLGYRSVRYLGMEVISDQGAMVEMFLKFDPEMDGIVLTVYNRNSIWRLDEKDYGIKCFTNADYEAIRSVKIKDIIWENPDQTKTMFELKLYGDGPGYYWCEAHSAYNFTLLRSKKIIAARKHKGHIFALFFDMPCEGQKCQEVHGNMKEFGKQAEKTMKNLMDIRSERDVFKELKINSVRVMNIEWIDENLQSISVLCHVSASLKNSAVDDSDEVSSEEDDEEEDNRGIRHDTSVRMTIRNLLSDLLKLHNSTSFAVNSTEFCFPELLPDNSKNQWTTATLGETSTTKELCLQPNGLPIARRCVGDFLYGAMWEKVASKQVKCIQKIPSKLITSHLYEIDHSKRSNKDPERAMKDIKSIIRKNVKHLIPADLFYLGRILRSISSKVIALRSMVNTTASGPLSLSTQSLESLTKATTSDIISIYNYLMKVNVDVIKPSIRLNSTNILLDAFERLIDEVSTAPHQTTVTGTSSDNNDDHHHEDHHSVGIVEMRDDENELIESINFDDGVVVRITPKLIVFVIDPNVANITGLALYKSKSDKAIYRGIFEDNNYRFLHSNQSIEELLEEDDLQLATFVPEILLERLDEISSLAKNLTAADHPDPRIVIKIFTNDKLFQEDLDITDKKVYSKIVSVSIPGHDRDLPELLPLIMRTPSDNNNETEASCRYWDYNTWAKDGLVFLGRSQSDNNLVWCGCSHLTPFALLIGGYYNLTVSSDIVVITDIHREALDIITLMGCSLSLIGIIGIFITAVTFQTWREKASSKVLLQLSLAIALQMVLFCFVNTEDYTSHLIENHIFSSCVALGACLQYSVLVQFCWMMIIAYLQFKRYVKVFGNSRPKRFFIKSFCIGWGVPLIPVLLVVLLDRQSYIPRESSGSAICYPTGRSLYLGICLPVASVIVGNLVIFIAVIYNIVHGPDISIRHNDKRMAISQIRLSVLLFFLLGFTWIFGLLTAMKAGIIFSYLFSITATIQGFVLFVYFILLDPVTRSMWTGYLGRICGVKNDKNSKEFTTSMS